MTFALVKPNRVLPTWSRAPYDVGDPPGPDPTGECVPGDISDPLAVSRQVAAALRADILSGELAPDSEMPSQRVLAQRYGKSEATINRGLSELARDGLIDMGPGRATRILPHGRYRVTVAVAVEVIPGDRLQREAKARLAEVAEANAAIARATFRWSHGVVAAEFIVDAADAARASVTALAATVLAAGIDRLRAQVSAEPA